MSSVPLTPEVLLWAYGHGIFPMAVPELGHDIHWFAPDPRAIIPLDALHVSDSLRRTVRLGRFQVVADRDFQGVMRACAAPRPTQPETWISEAIVSAYTELFRLGHAHSVECYRAGELAGGLYGVAIGGAFFGESMFHRARDASKVALCHLVASLHANGFTLLDVQYQTPHLRRLGAVEILRAEYERRLAAAVELPGRWRFEPSS